MWRVSEDVNTYEFSDNSGCVFFKHATGEAIALRCSLIDVINDTGRDKETSECSQMLHEEGYLSITK